jgi:hypothetical protein
VRRLVRTTEDFWASLDRALPTDHEPSWHAFAAHDLPDAIERFATAWDVIPLLIPGRPDYRVIIDAGRTRDPVGLAVTLIGRQDLGAGQVCAELVGD